MNPPPSIPDPPPPLPGTALARTSDPETSQAAAADMKGVEATRRERIALMALRLHPAGLTNHALVLFTGLDWNTVTPRIRPLVKKGLVVDSGERRMGPKGKRCIVWKAT